MKYLGVYIGHNRKQCYTKNWKRKTGKEKIQNNIEQWKKRHLTLFGKILVIKTLAISILTHPMTILSTPDDVLKEIEKIIFKFLWKANDRIKRKTLTGQKENGGLGMTDIYSKNKALKASWIKRLHDKNVNSTFLNMYLAKHVINCEYLAKSSITDTDHLCK